MENDCMKNDTYIEIDTNVIKDNVDKILFDINKKLGYDAVKKCNKSIK